MNWAEILKDFIYSAPVTGSARFALIVLACVSMYGGNQLKETSTQVNEVNKKLDFFIANINGLTQEVKDNHSDISVIKTQITSILLSGYNSHPSNKKGTP